MTLWRRRPHPYHRRDQISTAYATNIQVADLNALNAALAVVKWKKIRGFYYDHAQEHHCSYTTDFNEVTNKDVA